MSAAQTLSPTETEDRLRGSGFSHDGKRLTATFDTSDFATGARLVAAVAKAAEELNHHPDITLSYGSVGFQLSSHDAGGVTDRDVELARRILEAAEAVGARPDTNS